MKALIENRSLFCADNLGVLGAMADGSVDLVATDPPGFSEAPGPGYDPAAAMDGLRSVCPAAWELARLTSSAAGRGAGLVWGDGTAGRLADLAVRLVEMRRVLRPEGSIWVQCGDYPHLVRMLMDAVFGTAGFRNEIAWCRPSQAAGGPGSHFPRRHDTILFYSRSTRSGVFHRQFKDTPDGGPVLSWWDDCGDRTAVTRRGRSSYPTERPLSLYKRIIRATSEPGDVVLDPFAGSGTTCVAAEGLGRRWVGADDNQDACEIARGRLLSECSAEARIISGPPAGAASMHVN